MGIAVRADSPPTGLPLRSMDLNSTIFELKKLLDSILNERIAMRTELDPRLLPVAGDSRRIASILVRLFIQVRDALPEGSLIVVKTANTTLDAAAATDLRLPPGQYVQLRLYVSRPVEIEMVREMVEHLQGAITLMKISDERFAVVLTLPPSNFQIR